MTAARNIARAAARASRAGQDRRPAPDYSVRKRRGRFYVEINGKIITGGNGYESYAAALSRVEKLTVQMGLTVRKCMCCRVKFPSEGPHNRLCTICRGKTATIYDV